MTLVSITKARAHLLLASKSTASHREAIVNALANDEKKLAAYLNFIHSVQGKDEEGVNAALAKLESDPRNKYTPSEIYSFCLKNDEFKNYIQQKNCPLVRNWQSTLKSKEYNFMGEEAIYYDEKLKHTIADSYQAAFLLSTYQTKIENSTNRAEALAALDLACEFNLFEALHARCKASLVIIQKTKFDDERTLAIGQVLEDTKKLALLYGTVGSFAAATISTTVAAHYANLQDPNFQEMADYFDKKALQYFYSGKDLLERDLKLIEESEIKAKLEQNKMIIAAACKDKGLGIFGFATLEEAEDNFLSPFVDEGDIENKLRFRKAFADEAKEYIDKLLSKAPQFTAS